MRVWRVLVHRAVQADKTNLRQMQALLACKQQELANAHPRKLPHVNHWLSFLYCLAARLCGAVQKHPYQSGQFFVGELQPVQGSRGDKLSGSVVQSMKAGCT